MKPAALIFVLTLAHALPSDAQFATIRDTDGYTNVRSGDSINAKIIGRFHNGDVFVYTYTKNGWTTVYYHPSATSDSGYLTGYIHADRLRIIEDLPHIAETHKKLGKDHLLLQNDSVTVELTSAAFRHGEHLKLTGLHLTISGKPIDIPKAAWSEVYDAPLRNIDMYFDRTTGFMYLDIPAGGNGAEAAYQLVWVFKDRRYIRRYIDGF